MDPNVVNAVVEDGRASSQDPITAYALAHTQGGKEERQSMVLKGATWAESASRQLIR
jgi:hypothetical protein